MTIATVIQSASKTFFVTGDDPAVFEESTVPFGSLYEDDEWLEPIDLFELLGYEEVPILLVDTDPERAVARQKEMTATCFEGIDIERRRFEKMQLAMQQLDVEQRHALRLLLIYQDAEELTAHLVRCLEDPEYGYGERGDNGRTIAQAMVAVSEDEDWAKVAKNWLDQHRDFQQKVLRGTPFNFRSLCDFADLGTFVPAIKRVGTGWQLGIEGEGDHIVFQGDIISVWPRLCDTFVEWHDRSNGLSPKKH